jgi:cell division protein DivIC
MAKKKKVSKSSKRRLAFFGTISIVIIFYFLFSLGFYAYKIYNLKIEEKNKTEELKQLQKEEKTLSTDMEKLKDKDYLAKYAREAYSYSKDDEIIIQKYEEETTEENTEKIKFSNKDLLIIAICVVIIIIIIIYIIIKSKKKNKRK